MTTGGSSGRGVDPTLHPERQCAPERPMRQMHRKLRTQVIIFADAPGDWHYPRLPSPPFDAFTTQARVSPPTYAIDSPIA